MARAQGLRRLDASAACNDRSGARVTGRARAASETAVSAVLLWRRAGLAELRPVRDLADWNPIIGKGLTRAEFAANVAILLTLSGRAILRRNPEPA